jgi:leader peptidase (prepilin peptidase)/N-methyltransferase
VISFKDFVSLLCSPLGLGLIGLCIGSFLNVVVYRLPLMLEREWWGYMVQYLNDEKEWHKAFGLNVPRPPVITDAAAAISQVIKQLPLLSMVLPRSHCPALDCGHQIRWFENIPLFSWIALRGRCAACKTLISKRYPIVEITTGLLFMACGAKFGTHPATLVWCFTIAFLIAGALIDLDTTLLPDSITLPLIGLGIVASAAKWTQVSPTSSAIGAVTGYGSLWLINWFYEKTRGATGMAEGDMKLLAGLGALLGWQLLPSIVLLSSAVGALVGLWLIIFKGHQKEVPIPFGPYLGGGGIAAIFFGPQLMQLWWPTT